MLTAATEMFYDLQNKHKELGILRTYFKICTTLLFELYM